MISEQIGEMDKNVVILKIGMLFSFREFKLHISVIGVHSWAEMTEIL